MQAALAELAQKSGQDFGVAYINMLIPHQGDLEVAQVVMDSPLHPEVRDAAA